MTRRAWLAQSAAVPYLSQRSEPARPGPFPHAETQLAIGLFAPPESPLAQGAAKALSQSQLKLTLLTRWAPDPWRAGAPLLARLCFEHRVLALLSGHDSASAHLAAQIAAKALVPLLDPITSDESLTAAGVPWIFAYAPPDSAHAQALAQALNRQPYSLLAATDHASRHLALALTKLHAPAERHDFAPNTNPPQPTQPQTVLLAPPETAARLKPILPKNTLTPNKPDPTELARKATALLLECIQQSGPDRNQLRIRLAPHFNPNGRRPHSSVIL